MSILKYENRTPRNIQKMYEYMIDSNKTDDRGIFGLGVNPYNAANEMLLVQFAHGKPYLPHEYVQVIFAFDVGITLDIEVIREICIKIGSVLVIDERQVFGAIHYLNTDKIHCHYMINYVGIDGSLHRQGYSVCHYRDLVNEILQEYGLNLVGSISQNKDEWEGDEYYDEFEDYNLSTEYDDFFDEY